MKPGMPQSQSLKNTLKSVIESVSASLKAPVAKTDVEIDLRSQYIRTQEVCLGEKDPETYNSIVPQPDGFKQLVC
jgi:hypothetical protein